MINNYIYFVVYFSISSSSSSPSPPSSSSHYHRCEKQSISQVKECPCFFKSSTTSFSRKITDYRCYKFSSIYIPEKHLFSISCTFESRAQYHHHHHHQQQHHHRHHYHNHSRTMTILSIYFIFINFSKGKREHFAAINFNYFLSCQPWRGWWRRRL